MKSLAWNLLSGTLAGAVATLPMTVAMEAMFRRLPWMQRHPLPPRTITVRMAERAGIAHQLDEQERRTATLASHFGYGASMGGVYGAVHEHIPLPLGVRGAAFGLAVWAASYQGWLPAAGILPAATSQPSERNHLMIAAHVVWGVSLDVLLAMMQRNKKGRDSIPSSDDHPRSADEHLAQAFTTFTKQ